MYIIPRRLLNNVKVLPSHFSTALTYSNGSGFHVTKVLWKMLHSGDIFYPRGDWGHRRNRFVVKWSPWSTMLQCIERSQSKREPNSLKQTPFIQDGGVLGRPDNCQHCRFAKKLHSESWNSVRMAIHTNHKEQKSEQEIDSDCFRKYIFHVLGNIKDKSSIYECQTGYEYIRKYLHFRNIWNIKGQEMNGTYLIEWL